ncbi:class I SAM-dependent methyltransferase [uncultured Rubinisphaera sp.]|uniref:class I SAM-dependent methyltransferase n=1 Tax=uncultured Rubinisphaera sp. TaxID=1678686 RepID=UPI0030D75DB2
MPLPQSISSNARVLWHLALNRVTGNTHEERLSSFYEGQAGDYDSFRKKLLHGRQEMLESIVFPDDGIWVDLGAGTGSNAEYVAETIPRLKKVYQVDLCEPLLDVARERVKERNWPQIVPIHADATKFTPEEGYADVVTFSYSLTMIPDWFAAIDNAYRILKPGGVIGIVDFFVSRKYPADGFIKHPWSTRNFWTVWFSSDNVFLNGDHLPYLHKYFEPLRLEQRRGKVPFLPLVRAPHYIFLGKKSEKTEPTIS